MDGNLNEIEKSMFIIKNIIENYKGTITFETKYGEGTTFIVSLPIINT